MTHTKGQNSYTGTVHYAKVDTASGQLVQVCGIKANQTVYLSPLVTDTAITCRKCEGRTPKAAPKAQAERKTYGRQEWTITDLREVAKELKIAGRTTKDGNALLAEIVELAPQFG